MSLYRKYRPQTFSHLVGQEHINQTLLNALKLDRVSHAYLFTGPRGTGKTSTARLLAKAINCLNPLENEPCNSCEICVEINDGRLIDLIEIDAASNRGIDEIRELRDKINFSPSRAKSKIYIIDEVHMLTKEAFNALLKTLEEPPSHVYFILATTEAHKIPETILSRCQRFDFKRIDEIVLKDRLKYIADEEGIVAEDKALELISNRAEGGLRDAIGLLEQLSTDKNLSFERTVDILGISDLASLENLYNFLIENDVKQAIKEIFSLYDKGFDLLFFNKRFLDYLRKQMIKSIEINDISKTNRILNFIENFRQSLDQSKDASIPQLPLEVAIVKSTIKTVVIDKNVDEKESSDKVLKPVINNENKSENIEFVNKNQEIRTHKKITENSGISLENIQKNWNNIVEKINSPIVKRTLKPSFVERIEGNNLIISFDNQFNLNKMMETSNRNEAELAVFNFTGVHLKFVFEVRSSNIKNSNFTEEETVATSSVKDFEDTVADIFDGKII